VAALPTRSVRVGLEQLLLDFLQPLGREPQLSVMCSKCLAGAIPTAARLRFIRDVMILRSRESCSIMTCG
jgi:hypothetical protein